MRIQKSCSIFRPRFPMFKPKLRFKQPRHQRRRVSIAAHPSALRLLMTHSAFGLKIIQGEVSSPWCSALFPGAVQPDRHRAACTYVPTTDLTDIFLPKNLPPPFFAMPRPPRRCIVTFLVHRPRNLPRPFLKIAHLATLSAYFIHVN